MIHGWQLPFQHAIPVIEPKLYREIHPSQETWKDYNMKILPYEGDQARVDHWLNFTKKKNIIGHLCCTISRAEVYSHLFVVHSHLNDFIVHIKLNLLPNAPTFFFLNLLFYSLESRMMMENKIWSRNKQ